MKPFLRTLLIAASLIGGAVGGRLVAQQCVPCYNDISDGGPFGKYASQKCYMGYCQNGSLAECYRETCSACKWKSKLQKGCQAGQNYACPAQGNCVDNAPIEH